MTCRLIKNSYGGNRLCFTEIESPARILMSHWYRNLGFNRNLLVQLSGGPAHYQIDVYVVAQFQFFHTEDTPNWTQREANTWKQQFASLVYLTWSEKWMLVSTNSCSPATDDPTSHGLPTARVRVHAVDVEDRSAPLPVRQHMYAIHVYRQRSDAPRARQHADGRSTSRATVQDQGSDRLPSGTATAELYEDSLELGPASSVDGNRQVTAMHEFGHMLGLMHPNDMQIDCMQDRSARSCYGQPGSAESGSIMGRGQEVRREDYRVFPGIMSQLVREYSEPGFAGMFTSTHLFWAVEGTTSRWCEGRHEASGTSHPSSTRRLARAPGAIGSRWSHAAGRVPGPIGIG